MAAEYLTYDELLAIHADQIERYGGSSGLRDLGLIGSALAMPEATFDGIDLHQTLFEKAAAYLYHLAQNHPFVDGNKRIACAAALTFLDMNGVCIAATEDELTHLVLGVASGSVSKASVAVFFERHAEP